MERQVSDMNILEKFVTSFCKVLEKHTRYIIVSGFVAIASGRARGTEDIDIITEKISKEQFESLHKDLVKNGFVCMQSDNVDDIYEYLDDKTSIRYTWEDNPLPEMEIKFAKDVLDEEQLKTRRKLWLTGIDVWFSSIEGNIAFKEYYLGSDKDLEDAKHLRIAYADDINENEITRFKELIKKVRM